MNANQYHIGVERNWLAVVLFSFLTLGIYGLYYWVQTLGDLRRHGGVGPGGVGVLALFVPVFNLVLAVLIPEWIGRMNRSDGLPEDVSPLTALWIFVPLVGGFIYIARIQGALNRHWRKHGDPSWQPRDITGEDTAGGGGRSPVVMVVVIALIVVVALIAAVIGGFAMMSSSSPVLPFVYTVM